MLQEIELGRSGLRAPAIGFGCAALLGRAGKSASKRALAAAWDEGVRFFDTARSYGYGESEGLLGAFLKGRRDKAIIATKFGIQPAPQPHWKRIARSAARSLLAVTPSARSLVRKAAGTQLSSGQFTTAVLQRSIEQSLRMLQTDYVDVLFMHAAPATVLEQEDLLGAMGRLVEQGKVRLAGLSSEPGVVETALQRQTAPLRAMQFPCNVFELSAAFGLVGRNASGALLVANHPFGGATRVQACRTILRQLAVQPDIDVGLREKLGTIDDHILADIVFACILRETGIHIVIPAMMQMDHVRANVRAISESRFSSADIRTIRASLYGLQRELAPGH